MRFDTLLKRCATVASVATLVFLTASGTAARAQTLPSYMDPIAGRAARAFKLPLVPLAVSGADVTAVNGRPASTLQGQRAWMLDLKPDEQMATAAELLNRYVGDLTREMADPGASRTAFARWEAYERLTWPEWLRSRGASTDAIRHQRSGLHASSIESTTAAATVSRPPSTSALRCVSHQWARVSEDKP